MDQPSQPAISVIVPAYNREAYLEQCLTSITNQTLRDIEIICIDDGSTDGTLAKLKELQARDSRIRIISRENRGASVSRNEGIEAATGQYVIFMDSDDFYPDNDILETLYTKAIENNVKICGGSLTMYNDETDTLELNNNPDLAHFQFLEDALIQYRDWQVDWGFTRFIYDREMLVNNQIMFPPYKRYEDPVFFVRAHLAAGKFYACKKIVYAYRTNHKEPDWREETVHEILRAMQEVWQISVANKLTQLQKYCCRCSFYNQVKHTLTPGELAFLDTMEYTVHMRPRSLHSWIYKKSSSQLLERRRHLRILGMHFSYFRK